MKKVFHKYPFFILSYAMLIFMGYVACEGLHLEKQPEQVDDEPPYTARIVWEADTSVYNFSCMIMENEYIYFHERQNEGKSAPMLAKLNAQTGQIVWKVASDYTSLRRPVINGDYLYVFMNTGYFLCFEKETGKIAAKVVIDINNQGLTMYLNATGYENYLYFGIGNYTSDNYFARFDTGLINMDGGAIEQRFEAEVVWRSQYDFGVYSTPVFYNKAVYAHTFVRDEAYPVELIGINTETREQIFYYRFGNEGAYSYERGGNDNSLLLVDNILYFISASISAYNLTNGRRLYYKKFEYELPAKENYSATDHVKATYYNGKIYYTTISSNGVYDWGYDNIFCIDAKTGNLVWSDMPKRSESLMVNPVIAHKKMYVTHGYGLRVYNPENGKLIGVDKSFEGNAVEHNLLYGDYLITTRDDFVTNRRFPIVAIYVGE